jgi:hypothetical protein
MRITKPRLLAVGTLAVLISPLAAAANTATTTITAQLNSTISSFTTSSAITLGPFTPIVGGTQASASDTITVSTNAAAGYSLTLQSNTAGVTLVNGANTIATSAATPASPTTLANNTWGWREDTLSGFGAGPTNAGNANSATYAAFPATGAPVTLLARGAGPYVSDVQTIWYSVKADTSKPNGNYVNTALYTATAL